jgi:hypothetical protein
MEISNLVGLYVVLDGPSHEHYRTGQVVALAGDCALIQFDQLDPRYPTFPMELFHLDELCESCDHGAKLVSFFKTREAMFAWLSWLAEPVEKKVAGQTGKVVPIKPH